MNIVKAMVEQRRLAADARCRVKEWRVTDAQAWELAEEVRLVQGGFKETPHSLEAIVESMKAGNIRMLGAKVVVR